MRDLPGAWRAGTFAVALGCAGRAPPPAPAPPTRVWLDVDPSVGLPGKDVDDGVALLMALRDPTLEVVGASVVFGNAPVEDGARIARTLLDLAGRPDLPVHVGADGPGRAGGAAVDALAAALRDGPLTVLALGPLTHVADLITRHPDQLPRVQRVVFVGGRLPGQVLQTGAHRHRDFNVEQDGDAVRAVLDAALPLTLAPWALSRQVWLHEADLDAWAAGDPASAWLAGHARGWLDRWREAFGVDGFNPFDALAVELLTHPDHVACAPVGAAVVIAPDDRGKGTAPKPYLLVTPEAPRRVLWCDRAHDDVAAHVRDAVLAR